MLKILVVEDEEIIRKGIALAVDWAALDCRVVGEAANGLEGLEQGKALQPDVIITDLKMPKMDGLEMVEALRKAGCPAHVIILTAYDSFAYAQQAIRLGAVDFLLKPFHDGDLEEAVLRLQSRFPEKKHGDTLLPPVNRNVQSRYIREAMDYMEQNYADSNLSVGQIAARLGLSEGHLSHLFKKEAGCTVGNYLTRCRIQQAMALLKGGNHKVYEVAELCGYRDLPYFSGTFKKLVGMSPSEYQNL